MAIEIKATSPVKIVHTCLTRLTTGFNAAETRLNAWFVQKTEKPRAWFTRPSDEPPKGAAGYSRVFHHWIKSWDVHIRISGYHGLISATLILVAVNFHQIRQALHELPTMAHDVYQTGRRKLLPKTPEPGPVPVPPDTPNANPTVLTFNEPTDAPVELLTNANMTSCFHRLASGQVFTVQALQASTSYATVNGVYCTQDEPHNSPGKREISFGLLIDPESNSIDSGGDLRNDVKIKISLFPDAPPIATIHIGNDRLTIVNYRVSKWDRQFMYSDNRNAEPDVTTAPTQDGRIVSTFRTGTKGPQLIDMDVVNGKGDEDFYPHRHTASIVIKQMRTLAKHRK